MRIRTWGYFLSQALISMVRNSWMTIASVGTVGVAMLIFGGFMLIASNLSNLAVGLESQVEMSVYLQDEMSPEDINAIGARISTISGVASLNFVSKDDALVRLQEWYGADSGFLAGLELDNPLRDSYEVRTHNPQDVLTIAPVIEGFDGVAEVIYGRSMVERLFALTRIVRLVAVGLMVGLASAALFIIANTIRITVFARRREIGIMKFVGATDWFIRWPFIMEGVLLGLIGSLMSAVLLSWLYRLAVTNMQISLPFLPLVAPTALLGQMFLMLLGLGIGIGVLGSVLSLRRFLRV